MKLEKLTKEQEALIPVVRDEWINKLMSCRKLDQEACRAGIEWLYSFTKLDRPCVLFTSSPLGAQYAANMFRKAHVQVRVQVSAQVCDQVYDQVSAQVRDQVNAQVCDQVYDQVSAQVRDQVRVQVYDQVSAQVYDQVRVQVCDQVNAQYFYSSSYGNCWDLSWLSFYDYFNRISFSVGDDNYKRFARLIDSGIYDCIQLKGLCIVCENPLEIHRDEKHRLHSTTGPAIKWADGYELYRLWGVLFEKPLWEQITKNSISPKKIFEIGNIEQRMAALKHIGIDKVLDDKHAKTVHKSKRGNELLKVTGIFRTPKYCLRYKCPSTGREYVSFVSNRAGEAGDADAAMASKFNLSKEQYDHLQLES
jgi:hypothetical protein